jgi:Fe2+ transport system protein FeoA
MRMRLHRRRWGARHRHHAGNMTLAEVMPGEEALVLACEMEPELRQSLHAYGLLPGRRVRVISQRPTTMLQIEQTELAIENQIAREILVRVDIPEETNPA